MSEEQKVAEVLRQTRTELGSSMEDVRRRTGLSINVIGALEEGRFDVIERPFLRLALRSYVGYLRLDPAQVLAALERQYAEAEALRVATAPPPAAPMTRPRPHASWGLRMAVAALGVVALAAVYVLLTRGGDDEPSPEALRAELPVPPEHPPASTRTRADAPAESEASPPVRGTDTISSSAPLTMPGQPDEAPAQPAPMPESATSMPPTTASGLGASPAGTDATRPGAVGGGAAEPASVTSPSSATAAAVGSPATGTAAAAAAPAAESAAFPPVVAAGDRDVVLSVQARDTTWVQVMAGDRVVFQGTLAPGNQRTWRHTEGLVVHAGRARGLRYWLQGQPIADSRLGDPNRILRFRATHNGVSLINPPAPAAPRDSTAVQVSDPPR
jgi:cytoskeletal protein RodZ